MLLPVNTQITAVISEAGKSGDALTTLSNHTTHGGFELRGTARQDGGSGLPARGNSTTTTDQASSGVVPGHAASAT